MVPIPPAQGLVVLSFATIPAALDRLAEIVATGPVAVEMLDRMILDLAAQNPRYSHVPRLRRGPPRRRPGRAVLRRQPDELADRADDLARRFEGRPGVLGVRTSLTDAGQGRLLEGPQGRVLAPDGRWSATPSRSRSSRTRPSPPSGCPSSTTGSARSSRGTGSTAACYGHADVGCLHIRPILNVKTARGGRAAPDDRARGLRPGRRVRRRDERRARRRPGPQRLERQAVRPRGLRRASRPSSAPSTPTTG